MIIKRQRNQGKTRIVIAVITILIAGSYPCSAQRDLPVLKDYGLKEYVYTSKDLPRSEDKPWTLVCRLPYNAQFTTWIQLRSDVAGKTIKFDSTNPLTYCKQKEQSYITIVGEQSYEMPRWVSGEGARYTIPAGVTVLGVKYRETGYNTEFTGSFSCNDEDYNCLWKKATRTCYLCMREHFMDCPDRERAEWLGDAVLQMEECFYAFDLSSHQIVRKFIRSRQLNGLPGQDLIAHGEYGDWNYYLYTGDLETLKFIYSNTKKYLDGYVIGKNGLPNKRKDGWDWYDWGKGYQDKTLIQVTEYYGAISALKKMAEATGNTEDIPDIKTKLISIRNNFDRFFWKNNGYRSGEQIDERANSMAVCAGLADRSKWDVIAKLIGTEGQCGPYFERWVLEALCVMGKEEQALLRMYNRYELQIKANITTLYEYVVRAHEDKTGIHSVNYTTLNHGWNVPNTILSKFIAGVAPETPGWDSYHVFPQEAFLTSLAASITTVKGQLEVDIKKSESEYSITLESPANTNAIVGFPKKAFTNVEIITANGKMIWNGAYVGELNGISWNGEDDKYIKFNVAPGKWILSAQGAVKLSTPKQPSLATKPHPLQKLNKKSWKVSASIDNQRYKAGPWGKVYNVVDAPAVNALDGDSWTGWRTMEDQVPGQWFVIDMGQSQLFNSIILDNTWAIHDSPAGYAIYVTDDTNNWGKPILKGAGDKTGITVINFKKQNARYIKIEQTGTKNQFWSIFEVDVCI